jgi:polar amino acid transport system substrate-binding protein
MRGMLIGALALGLMAGTALAQTTEMTVRMGTEGAYPPYNLINDKGEVDGFERELGDELCRRAKIECTWVTNEWDSIIPNLVSGNYDAIMAGMSITDERDAVIDFTQAYLPPTPSIYVALAGSDPDLENGIIAAQVNTIQASHVAETGANLLEFATPDETIAAVRNGEADAVLADSDYLRPIVEQSGGELAVVGDPIDIGGGIGMGVRESDPELKAVFDEAIAAMKEDGTLNPMITKWFGDEMPTW